MKECGGSQRPVSQVIDFNRLLAHRGCGQYKLDSRSRTTKNDRKMKMRRSTIKIITLQHSSGARDEYYAMALCMCVRARRLWKNVLGHECEKDLRFVVELNVNIQYN